MSVVVLATFLESVRTRKLAVLAGMSIGPKLVVKSVVLPDLITSSPLIVTVRVAGFVAYTCVSTVMTPEGWVGSSDQSTLTAVVPLVAVGPVPHVFEKESVAGVALLVMFQGCFRSWVALMSLLSSWGATSLGLME